jgi:hypothetical protein
VAHRIVSQHWRRALLRNSFQFERVVGPSWQGILL